MQARLFNKTLQFTQSWVAKKFSTTKINKFVPTRVVLLPKSRSQDAAQQAPQPPQESMGEKAVFRALVGNAVITTLKLTCYGVTGSAAMLAEGFHTLVDSLNQGILYFGIRQAAKAPDSRHQYGYGRASYFWSLVSAMGVFWMGCCVTMYHGIASLVHPPEALDFGWLTAGVLIISFAIDGAVLMGVLKDIASTKPAGVSFLQHVKAIKDPFVVAVMLEDLAACTGVIIAMAGILATYFTGITAFDGMASIGIGVLLGLVSTTLVGINRRYLIGQAVEPEVEKDIYNMLKQRESIEHVYNIQSQWIGPQAFTIKVELDFDGSYFARQLQKQGYEDEFLMVGKDRVVLRALLARYTEDITKLVETEIDDIETQIRLKYPEAAFIEIEPSSVLPPEKPAISA